MDFWIGQIIQGGWNFAPLGSATCSGQLLPIQQNTALFALLGTYYGGNGQTTFALPDLRGRVMIGTGQGLGLPNYDIGEVGGNFQISLTSQNLPTHAHTFTSTSTLQASTTKAQTQVPAANSMIAHAIDGSPSGTAQPDIYIPSGSSTNAVNLAGLNVAGTIGPAGGSLPFTSMNPFLAVTFIIMLQGIFPSRN